MARNGIKSGGRKKGSLNKKTIEQLDRAETLLQLIESKYLEKDIAKLTSNQRAFLYANVLEYKAPKLSRIDATVKGNFHISDEPIIFE